MNVNAADRNRMYDTLSSIAQNFPDAKLEIVAIGIGAATATIQDGVLNITLEDGSGFAYVRALAHRFVLNAPNDYGSEADTTAAIEDCYNGDESAAIADGCREFFEVLAAAATTAELRYIENTGSGAIWEGTDAQYQVCRAALPAWAQPYASIVEE